MLIARPRSRNPSPSQNPSPHRSLSRNLALNQNQNRNPNRAQILRLNPNPSLNRARKTERLSHLRSFPRWKSLPRLQKRCSTCSQQKPLDLEHLRQSRSLNLSPHQHQRRHRHLNSHRPQPRRRHLLPRLIPSLRQRQTQMNHP